MRIIPVVLALAACVEGPGERSRVASPADGAVVRSPWVPVVVRLPERFIDADVEAWLDGEPADDPLGFMQDRDPRWGLGVDWIATLPVVGLSAGPHRLSFRVVRPDGETRDVVSAFVVEHGPCDVRLRTVDELGEPISARVVVHDADGPVDLAAPNSWTADPRGRDGVINSVFAVHGEGRVHVACGAHTFYAVRGPRDHVGVQTVDLQPGVTEVLLRVGRAVPTPGRSTADLHVHTGHSGDAWVPDRLRYESLLAAGLDLFVITDHNVVVDPSAAMALLGGAPVRGLPGNESRIGRLPGAPQHPESIGHLNAFPLAAGAALPDTEQPSVAAHIDAYRARQRQAPYEGSGELVVQLNHPRGIHFRPEDDPKQGAHAIFKALGYDRSLPLDDPHNRWMLEPEPGTGTTFVDFDAIEVVNRFSWPLYQVVRQDWFALLGQGVTLTGTGNSDSHALEVETAGFPVNLVPCAPPAEAACLVEAVREGRVVVSTGPIVDLEVVGDVATGGPGDRVLATRGAVARVRVRAAPWVPVPEVRLVVDGELVQRAPAEPARGEDGVLDATWEWSIAPGRDVWVIAEAGWPIEQDAPMEPGALGIYGIVAPGHVPLGFTNPVRLDVTAATSR